MKIPPKHSKQSLCPPSCPFLHRHIHEHRGGQTPSGPLRFCPGPDTQHPFSRHMGSQPIARVWVPLEPELPGWRGSWGCHGPCADGLPLSHFCPLLRVFSGRAEATHTAVESELSSHPQTWLPAPRGLNTAEQLTTSGVTVGGHNWKGATGI